MGTTAEKLAYLKESKEQIKNVLETPHNVMRDYPALIKKYIDNQPISIVTDGICKNALDVPLVSLGVDGNSKQKSYEGHNLCEETILNANLSPNGYIISTTEYNMNIAKVQKDETYIIQNATGSLVYGFFTEKPQIDSLTYNGTRIVGSTTQRVIISEITGYIAFRSEVANTNVMIVKGTEEKTYEPYVGGQPSPNPKYPQDIEVIDGVNEFDGECLNGYYNSDGIFQNASNQLCTKNFIKVKPNTTYWLGILFSDNGNLAICLYDKNQNFISRVITDLYKGNGISYTIDDKTYYIKINFSPVYGNTYNNNVIVTKGTTPKPYLPHGHIGLRQSGEQLLDTKSTFTYEYGSASSGINFMQNNDGSISINGTAKEIVIIDFKLPNYIPIGTTINLSISEAVTNLQQSLRNSSHNILGETYFNGESDKTATLTDSAYYYRIQINKDSVMNTTIKPMLIKGTIPAPFEPYHSPKVYPINLNGNSISKVGDVKDLLKIYRNGDVEIDKNSRKYNFDDLNFTYSNERFFSDALKNVIKETKYGTSISNISSDIYSAISPSTWYNKNENGISVGLDGYAGKGYVLIYDNNYSNKIDFKNAVAGHYLYVELKEPETIKLPSIEPIELWEGTNKFELITNLDTTFEMEYVVNKDYLETQNLLNIVEGENI